MSASDTPKVSVVICTYNQQAFVRETVESVLAQTYGNLEIIVAYDGSTDDTPRILDEDARRFPDKIKLALSPVNSGIPTNINCGLALRTGELTAWLDGDDLMLPGKIEKQVAALLQHPEATGCYHDSEVLESETGRVGVDVGALQRHVRPQARPAGRLVPTTLLLHPVCHHGMVGSLSRARLR